jgi:HEAT repeat protein
MGIPIVVGCTVATAWLLSGCSKEAKLINRLKNKDPQVRKDAASELYRLEVSDYKRAMPVLIQLLNDKDRGIQVAAAVALGEIGDNRAVPALLQALEDRSRGKNTYLQSDSDIIVALGKIADARALPALKRAVKEHSKGEAFDYVKNEAIEAIMKIKLGKDYNLFKIWDKKGNLLIPMRKILE